MEMNIQHEKTLKQMLSADTLPAEVVAEYKKFRTLADRADLPMTAYMLLVCASKAKSVEASFTQPVTPAQALQTADKNGLPCKVLHEGNIVEAFLLDKAPKEAGMMVVRIGKQEIEVLESNVKI
jgi:hypothetical protein